MRRDVEAYAAVPPTAEEAALGRAQPGWNDLHDETDWDAEWPENE